MRTKIKPKSRQTLVVIFFLAGLSLFFTNCKLADSFVSTDSDTNTDQSVPPQNQTPDDPVDASKLIYGLNSPIEVNTSDIIENAGYLSLDGNSDGLINIDGQNYQYNFHRNLGYKCGKSGYYTFLVIQKQSLTISSDLWVFLHGGGSSICRVDEFGNEVCGDSPYMSEQTVGDLFQRLKDQAVKNNGKLKNTLLGNRLKEGYRILLPTMCDHDLYAGLGNLFPHNPYWPGETPTVDGLVATLSAINYIGKKYPTSGRLYLQGSSAGSAGAFNTSLGLLHNGQIPSAVILDSGGSNDRDEILDYNVCSLTYNQSLQIGYTVEQKQQAMADKGGVLLQYRENHTDARIGKNGIPYFMIVGDQDEHCCGTFPAIPEAKADGFSNNCAWKYAQFDDILKSNGDLMSKVSVVVGASHVVTDDEDSVWGSTHQKQLEDWFLKMKNTNRPEVKF